MGMSDCYQTIASMAVAFAMTSEKAAELLWNHTSFPFVPRDHDWQWIENQIEDAKYYFAFKGTWRD